MSLLGDKAAEIACRVILSAKKWSKKASDCLKVLDSDSWWLKSHFVEYGVVVDSKGNVVHEILVVSMLAPWSYRRAYVIELQCHSSKVCLYCVLRTCVDVGAILVELDMRCMFQESLDFMCVLNGCLDLIQAENVEKLISTKSSSPADAALEGIHASLCPPFKG
ncbi:hypothetical protein DY000_02055458 [Brassica cretica]|uniref:GTP-binding protein TrmE N-terminal domain-containing protein n=1 Tax=Brassica cretica TaxID=69181 RepID=A0ABQ7A6G4_BRACR|nr:hypothetical protein DY000_02055458 [Brassica cretica]